MPRNGKAKGTAAAPRPAQPRKTNRRPRRQQGQRRARNQPPIDGDVPFTSYNVSEPLSPIVVPADSAMGTLLYAEECNPARLGEILRAQASQSQSWRGDYVFKMRVNGSVNAKNYAIARWLPDADKSKLPLNKDRLWKYVRGTAQDDNRPDRAFVKYNIISETNRNSSFSVRASWKGTFNPKKPIDDTDPSERSLGLFVIVSNGPPGEAITIDVDVHAVGKFYGPTPTPTIINSAIAVTATPTSLSIPFGPNTTVQGPGSASATGTVLSVDSPGEYLVAIRYTGTGITGVPNILFSNMTPTTPLSGALCLSPTVATDVFRITVPTAGTMTFGAIAATTFTSITVRIAPYTVAV